MSLPINVVTHEGRHHADELLACWFLTVLHDDVRIVRTSDPHLREHADILVDCGGVYDPPSGRFDHHGGASTPKPPSERMSGYASAGLLWQLYGPRICERALLDSDDKWRYFAGRRHAEQVTPFYRMFANRLDSELVALVDAWDLGIYPPRSLSKQMLPLQWLLPFLDFDTAVDALGRAFLNRMIMLAEMAADELLLEEELLANGPSTFYAAGPWLVVVAPPHRRVEMFSAQLFGSRVLEMPLLAVLSSVRGGTKWGAFFSMPLPARISIPHEFEYPSGRRALFHEDREHLLQYVRGLAFQGLPVPEFLVR